MKKFKLHAIGNDSDYNHYEFDKKQEVIEKFAQIFAKILDIDSYLHYETGDKREGKKINFEKYTDKYESDSSSDKKAKITVIYGKKRIFLIVRCNGGLRLKFNGELFKYFEMPKYLKRFQKERKK